MIVAQMLERLCARQARLCLRNDEVLLQHAQIPALNKVLPADRRQQFSA
jgi:hypothetical protein